MNQSFHGYKYLLATINFCFKLKFTITCFMFPTLSQACREGETSEQKVPFKQYAIGPNKTQTQKARFSTCLPVQPVFHLP